MIVLGSLADGMGMPPDDMMAETLRSRCCVVPIRPVTPYMMMPMWRTLGASSCACVVDVVGIVTSWKLGDRRADYDQGTVMKAFLRCTVRVSVDWKSSSSKSMLGAIRIDIRPLQKLQIPAIDQHEKTFELITERACAAEIYDDA